MKIYGSKKGVVQEQNAALEMRRVPLMAAWIAAVTLLSGCVQYHRNCIITETGSVVGIDISPPQGVAMPHIRIGYVRIGAHIVPTGKGTNGIVTAPSFQNKISIGASSNAHITEDLAVGAATKNLNDR